MVEGKDANAQTAIGDAFHNGHIVPLDKHEAADWYRLAAEQGHIDAQLKLGRLLSSDDEPIDHR